MTSIAYNLLREAGVYNLLLEAGYREMRPPPAGAVALFVKMAPVPVPPCLTNDKTMVHVTIHDAWTHTARMNGEHLATFDIQGEAKPERWVNLQVYSVRVDDITDEMIREVERELCIAWCAMCGNRDTR